MAGGDAEASAIGREPGQGRPLSGGEMPDAGVNVAYILRCADGTLYTGWTNDMERRLASHNAGTGGKYTRVRIPVTLAYCEVFETKQEAMSREFHIKRLTRAEKEALISETSAV